MDLDRRTFYEKELELRMSMSLWGRVAMTGVMRRSGSITQLPMCDGPSSEIFQAFLDLAAKNSIDPKKMDVETVDFQNAPETYEALAKGERKSTRGRVQIFRRG